METIKSVIGLGKPAATEEPVNGETGAGTATEPYDAGNQDENPPSTAAHTTKVVSGEEPLNATTGAGTATEPYDQGNQEENPVAGVPDKTETSAPSPAIATTTNTVGTSSAVTDSSVAEPTAPVSDVSKSSAVPDNHTASAGDSNLAAVGSAQWTGGVADNKETVEKPSGGELAAGTAVASGAAVGGAAVAATSKETSKEAKETKEPVKSKEHKIGSAGWFKNALGRKKSESPSSKPDKSSAVKTPAPVAKVEQPKEASSAIATPAVLPKLNDETPKEEKSAVVAPVVAPVVNEKPKEVNSAPVPVTKTETKPIDKTKEHKQKKERSLSRDFKLFKGNPFKRNSKAGVEDEQQAEHTSESSKVPAAAAVAGAGVGGAVVAEKTKTEPAKEAITEPETEAIKEPTAPNHLPSEVPSGTAEPAAAGELPPLNDSAGLATSAAPGETSTSSISKDEVAPEVTTSRAVDDNNIAPDEIATSRAVDDDDIAPDEIAPGMKRDPVSETTAPSAGGLTVPKINEPAADSTESSGANHARRPSHHASSEHPTAIPTAGGIRLGEKAAEQRSTSQEIRRQSIIPPTGDTVNKSSTTDREKALPATPVEEKTTDAPKQATGLKRRASVFDKLKAKLKG